VQATPRRSSGAGAGLFSTSRYIGSVIGASVLAVAFAGQTRSGDAGPFVALFAGLGAVALAGIVVSLAIGGRPNPNVGAD
jgi:hypothetical protein